MRTLSVIALLSSLVLSVPALAEGPAASDKPLRTHLTPTQPLLLPTVRPLPTPREEASVEALGPALAGLVAATQTSARLGQLQEQVAAGARDGCAGVRCGAESW